MHCVYPSRLNNPLVEASRGAGVTAADRIADVGNVEGDRAKPMPAHWCAAPRRADAAFTLVTRAGP
ncbi:hypothetical protein XCR_3816 [Xanthomonas campestris pv. raphani 756C]|nr:hypothetical protein XCR_3816 [Xanthomonas campestris pv. raphani 756C]